MLPHPISCFTEEEQQALCAVGEKYVAIARLTLATAALILPSGKISVPGAAF